MQTSPTRTPGSIPGLIPNFRIADHSGADQFGHPHLTEHAIPGSHFASEGRARGSLQGQLPSTSMSGNQQTAANPRFCRNEA
jgi:hypothetical protein